MINPTGSPIKRDRLVACHEAGHAVMCVLEERSFEYVTIEPTDDADGHVAGVFHHDAEAHDGTDEQTRTALRIFLSGDAATTILGDPRDTSSSDWEHACSFAMEECGSNEEMSALLDYIWHNTLNELRLEQNWKAVEVLADALIQQGKIHYDQAEEIIRSAMDSP